MNLIKFIKMIERSSYPACYRQMQDCSTIDDIVEYCEAEGPTDLIIMTGKSWYFLAVKSTREIVDLAGKINLKELFKIKRVLKGQFNGRPVILDAREETSYRMIRKLGKIIKDNPYSWNNEIFHEMEIVI